MLKNSSTVAVSVPINLSIQVGYVSGNGPRETYFVDVPRNLHVSILIKSSSEISEYRYSLFRS